MSRFNDLDSLLHNQLRLSIVSILIGAEKVDFKYIKDKTEATSGNISVQISKLKDAGYIKVEKKFKNNYPQTTCSITKKGVSAFETYVNDIKSYLRY